MLRYMFLVSTIVTNCEGFQKIMLRYMFLVSTIVTNCEADYTIRTRQNDSRVILDEKSSMVISTISVPPYLSTFHNGSQGLVPDLLKVIQDKGGFPKEIDLRVTKEVTPGAIEGQQWSGIAEDAKFKYTHFAVGPIYDNLFLATEGIYFSSKWHSPLIRLLVSSDSILAKDQQINRQPNQYIDPNKVRLIVVDKSADFQMLRDYKVPLNKELDILRTLLRSNGAKVVDNICDGLRELGVLNVKDEPFRDKKSSHDVTEVLISNSLEADHFASGNEFVKIISLNNGNIAPFAFMSNVEFRKLTSKVNDAIGKKNTQIEIVNIVKKWSTYDKDACKKLRSSLSSGTSIKHFNLFLPIVIVLVVKLNR